MFACLEQNDNCLMIFLGLLPAVTASGIPSVSHNFSRYRNKLEICISCIALTVLVGTICDGPTAVYSQTLIGAEQNV